MESGITYDIRFATRMPKSYLRENRPETIRIHALMARQAATGEVVLYSRPTGSPRVFTVAVCAKDRPGLFSRIAGAFTLHGMNIVDARAYTTHNRIALDLFTVSLPLAKSLAPYDWEAPRRTIADSLAGRLDLGAALDETLASIPRWRCAPPGLVPDVQFVRDRSRKYTRITVRASDEPGLLYRLTHCLTRCHVNILNAEIRTEGFRARDVFHVRGMDGTLFLSEDRLSVIRRMLLRELAPSLEQDAGRRSGAGRKEPPEEAVVALSEAGG
ncbi:MAG: ACT domain-containing protein [Thermodesulfobacteriota bacterium]